MLTFNHRWKRMLTLNNYIQTDARFACNEMFPMITVYKALLLLVVSQKVIIINTSQWLKLLYFCFIYSVMNFK